MSLVVARWATSFLCFLLFRFFVVTVGCIHRSRILGSGRDVAPLRLYPLIFARSTT
jgi:hypothetical protein